MDRFVVKLSYPRTDGSWAWRHEELISVPSCRDHAHAERIARDRFNGCIIVNVRKLNAI